jgi:hypothetical protein
MDIEVDLERCKFLELETRILSNSPDSTKVKFLKGAIQFLGMTEVEAYKHLRDSCSINQNKRKKK